MGDPAGASELVYHGLGPVQIGKGGDLQLEGPGGKAVAGILGERRLVKFIKRTRIMQKLRKDLPILPL